MHMMKYITASIKISAIAGTTIPCTRHHPDIKNFLKKRKLDKVVAIVKSCTPNVIGNLIVTLKDLLSTTPSTIHHKVIDKGGYGKDITIGAALILANVLVYSPKLSMHYLNMAMRNMIKVFCKDIVPRSGSGIGKKKSWMRNMRDNYGASMKQLKFQRSICNCSQMEMLSKLLTLQSNGNAIKGHDEEKAFVGFLHDQCAGLRMTNSKNQRLVAELEALGEQGDVVKCLDHMREIVAIDHAKLRVLEQLLAETNVGIGLKDSYVTDIEEKE
ncbi:GPCR kinase [Tanacetum coccineum]